MTAAGQQGAFALPGGHRPPLQENFAFDANRVFPACSKSPFFRRPLQRKNGQTFFDRGLRPSG
jgi:hypothetical protein